MPGTEPCGESKLNGKLIAARTLIQAGVVAAVALSVLLVIKAAEVFLVVFGGILLAVLFQGTGSWLSHKMRLPEKLALAIAIIAPALLLTATFWFIAPDITEQADQLATRIPEAVQQLQDQALQYEWIQRLANQQDRLEKMIPGGSKAVSTVAGIFSSTFGALGNLVFAFAVGIFLAVSPAIYIGGLLRLVPLNKRTRAKEVLTATGSTLRQWLVAKIVEMAVIGVFTTLGLWLIGIELALVLGLIAGILSFIPNIGPIMALVPAVLLALISGTDKVVYVILMYSSIQAIESYLLTPLLQKRMVDLPPALTISMQILFGMLAGGLGIIMATPLTAALMVMTKMWYVEDLLGDKE